MNRILKIRGAKTAVLFCYLLGCQEPAGPEPEVCKDGAHALVSGCATVEGIISQAGGQPAYQALVHVRTAEYNGTVRIGHDYTDKKGRYLIGLSWPVGPGLGFDTPGDQRDLPSRERRPGGLREGGDPDSQKR